MAYRFSSPTLPLHRRKETGALKESSIMSSSLNKLKRQRTRIANESSDNTNIFIHEMCSKPDMWNVECITYACRKCGYPPTPAMTISSINIFSEQFELMLAEFAGLTAMQSSSLMIWQSWIQTSLPEGSNPSVLRSYAPVTRVYRYVLYCMLKHAPG